MRKSFIDYFILFYFIRQLKMVKVFAEDSKNLEPL